MGVEKRNTIVGLVALVVIFLFIFSFCNNIGKSSSSSSSSAKPTTKYVASGDRGYLNVNTYVAVTKEDFDLMTDFIIAKNDDGLSEMMVAGRVFSMKKDTEVNVISKKFASVEISSPSGSGWVPIEFVTKK